MPRASWVLTCLGRKNLPQPFSILGASLAKRVYRCRRWGPSLEWKASRLVEDLVDLGGAGYLATFLRKLLHALPPSGVALALRKFVGDWDWEMRRSTRFTSSSLGQERLPRLTKAQHVLAKSDPTFLEFLGKKHEIRKNTTALAEAFHKVKACLLAAEFDHQFAIVDYKVAAVTDLIQLNVKPPKNQALVERFLGRYGGGAMPRTHKDRTIAVMASLQGI